jgi:hypothetical protein
MKLKQFVLSLNPQVLQKLQQTILLVTATTVCLKRPVHILTVIKITTQITL